MTANTNGHKSPRAGKKRRALGYKGQGGGGVAFEQLALGYKHRTMGKTAPLKPKGAAPTIRSGVGERPDTQKDLRGRKIERRRGFAGSEEDGAATCMLRERGDDNRRGLSEKGCAFRRCTQGAWYGHGDAVGRPRSRRVETSRSGKERI
jgi:hypothetical protein